MISKIDNYKAKTAIKKTSALAKSLVNRCDNLEVILESELPDYKDIDNRIQNINYEAEKLFVNARRAYVNLVSIDDMYKDEDFGFIFKANEDEKIVREITTNSLLKKENNYYYLRLPKLVVKENHYNNPLYSRHDNYIRDLIARLSMEYESKIELLNKYSEYTIVLVHNYTDKNDDEDTDNISVKKVIDGLDYHIINNDTVKESHIIKFTQKANNDYTEVYILGNHDPFKRFLEWLVKANNNDKPCI